MKTQSGKIRIISGEYKGRILYFPAITGLRPTPERVRETLFNWIAPHISGSVCLDLFSGSGSLSFEALSRGAKNVQIIESNRTAARAIDKNIKILKCDRAKVLNQDSSRYLSRCSIQFDIVFLDPPFNSSLLQTSIDLITKRNLLGNSGWIYTEHSAHNQPPQYPVEWKTYRQSKAGDVRASLLQYEG